MRLAALGLAVVLLAGCGGGGSKEGSGAPPASPAEGPATIAGAGAATVAAGTARFTLTVKGSIAGADVSANEQGSLSFTEPKAHLYKVVLSGGIPQELVITGPFDYANGNIEAAMNDSTIRPWTKLDTRRLTPKQRLANDIELAHVRAPAFLIRGVARAVKVGAAGATTHFRGTVDPALLASRVPAALRASLSVSVRNDYSATPFAADFWIDAAHRVRRVHVSYRTAGGGRITVDATYSAFGSRVPLNLPPAREVQDITPR